MSPRQNGVDAVEGRTHRTIQTESWLEEIKGRVESSHQGVQTEAPIQYTPPEVHQRHLMIPPKGVDKCTQILPGLIKNAFFLCVFITEGMKRFMIEQSISLASDHTD